MGIIENYLKVRASIPDHVKLIVVTKFKPVEAISLLYDTVSHRDFGENRAQEFNSKMRALPSDIHWHFIGHLQTNKVKMVIPGASLIQSVDSMRLLQEINKAAMGAAVTAKVLLQFYIAEEETKFGFSYDEACQLLDNLQSEPMPNIAIVGVMGMASFTEDHQQVSKEFKGLRQVFEKLKTGYFAQSQEFKEVSMGMSGDYRIAMDEGSTMVRIGSLILGER